MPEPVSILLPAYNAAESLTDCVTSILKQTHRSFELIAVDDGSTDRTFEVLQRFAAEDSRVVALHSSNGGPAAAMNTALRAAKHDLVVRMDSDDIMLPERIERQLAFMADRPQIAVAGSYARLIDRNNKIIAASKTTIDVERGIRELNPALFVELIHPTCIMRKQAIVAVGSYAENYRFGEDRQLWGRLVTSGYQLAVQPEYLLHQRIHSSSLTGNRLRQNEMTCRYIDHNIVRRLQGQEENTYAEFLSARQRVSPWKRLSRSLQEWSMIRYKQATRHYAERQWIACAGCATQAVAMNPLYATRMARKLGRAG